MSWEFRIAINFCENRLELNFDRLIVYVPVAEYIHITKSFLFLSTNCISHHNKQIDSLLLDCKLAY